MEVVQASCLKSSFPTGAQTLPKAGLLSGGPAGVLPYQAGSCRTASPLFLSVLSVSSFMCQCCLTKHSTWTYPKSLYVGEWDLICIDMARRLSMNMQKVSEYIEDLPSVMFTDCYLLVSKLCVYLKKNMVQNMLENT